MNRLHVASTNDVEAVFNSDNPDVDLTAATATLHLRDLQGVDVTGAAWPLDLAVVNGATADEVTFRAELPVLGLTAGQVYLGTVVATAPGFQETRVIPFIASVAGLDGAVLRVDDVKDRLNVQHSRDDEIISTIIKGVEARFQGYSGRRLVAAPTTQYFPGGRVFFLRNTPVDPASIVITDTYNNDLVVDNDLFRISARTGKLTYLLSTYGWPSAGPHQNDRWKVEYTGGMSLDPDWNDIILPDLRASFMDFAVALYDNPDPYLKAEGDGGGLTRSLQEEDIPVRVLGAWYKYRPIM